VVLSRDGIEFYKTGPQLERRQFMSLLRTLVCILLPPAAVYDKGCGPIILTFVLWLAGWIPGVIAAMIFCTRVETQD
jgi:uncharacterized membrane protein YqaE (UPF0057 family)